MKFFAATAIASLTAARCALALPNEPKTHHEPDTFGLTVLRSGHEINSVRVVASNGGFFLNLDHQGAQCESTEPNMAIFYLKDGALFLYSRRGPIQQVFVDRSGLGQGKLGYVTGNGPPLRSPEFKSWRIDEFDDLYFNNASLIACPSSIPGDKSWSLWVVTESRYPGGHHDCLSVGSHTVPVESPVGCEYSH